MHTWFPRISLLLVLFTAWLLPTSAPSAQPIPFDNYDPGSVAAHVTMLANTIGPRAAGTLQERQAAEYISSQFTSYGYDTIIESFPFNGSGSQNVVATRPGLDPSYGVLYVGAHYDSIAEGPGANDNASGAAALLELARLFSSEAVSSTLTFIAFGSEEPRMVGSSAFVRQLDGGDRMAALGMINMDCVGVGSRVRLATIWQADRERNERVLRVAQQQASALGIQHMTSIKGDSDHEPFAVAGIPSVVVFADADGVPCGPDYHQPSDTSDKLDPELMKQIAQLVDATARDLLTGASSRPIESIRFPLITHGQQLAPYP